MLYHKGPLPVHAKMKEIGAAMTADWKKKASPEAVDVLNRYLALVQ